MRLLCSRDSKGFCKNNDRVALIIAIIQLKILKIVYNILKKPKIKFSKLPLRNNNYFRISKVKTFIEK